MAIEVFNRFEKKYIVDEATQQRLMETISLHMERDVYEGVDVFNISNIYYDTINNDLISVSIEKPVYKEKIRLRGYGPITEDSIVYLEIKKKYKGLVNKRRTAIKMSEAVKFIETKELPTFEPFMNHQVLNELHQVIKRYNLIPKVYLAYNRIAFRGINTDLRVTFDDKILTKREDISLCSTDNCALLLEENVRIMEIKTASSYPLWLCRLLNELGIYPTSFSKYGTEYKNSKTNEKRKLLYV